MSEYTRRRLLAIGGAATVAGLAGCSGAENTAETETPTEESASTGPVLESISLENLNDQSHTLDIFMDWDGENEYWKTHELAVNGETDSSLTLSGDWPTEPGPFQLIVRLDNDTRAQFSSTQLPERDCIDLVVMVTREGELSLLTDVSGGTCSTESTDSSTAE
jgi:hypothetical protein